jgi:hypothetical protein
MLSSSQMIIPNIHDRFIVQADNLFVIIQPFDNIYVIIKPDYNTLVNHMLLFLHAQIKIIVITQADDGSEVIVLPFSFESSGWMIMLIDSLKGLSGEI